MLLREQFQVACDAVIRESCATTALNYAVNYAMAGLSMRYPHEIQVQCLYILNNITHWRGPVAKQTRAMLKELAREGTWTDYDARGNYIGAVAHENGWTA